MKISQCLAETIFTHLDAGARGIVDIVFSRNLLMQTLLTVFVITKTQERFTLSMSRAIYDINVPRHMCETGESVRGGS